MRANACRGRNSRPIGWAGPRQETLLMCIRLESDPQPSSSEGRRVWSPIARAATWSTVIPVALVESAEDEQVAFEGSERFERRRHPIVAPFAHRRPRRHGHAGGSVDEDET